MFSVARLFARWALSGGSDGAFRRPGVGDRAPRGLALASLPRLTRVDGTRGDGRGGSRQRQSAVPASAPLLPAVYALLLTLYSLPAGAAPVGLDQQTTDGTSNISRFSIETTTSVGARANAYFSSLTNVGIGSTSPGAYLDVQMPASPSLNPFRLRTSTPSTVFEIDTTGTILSGTWNGTAVGATYGGTGQTVYVVGDILYANTTTTLARLPATTSGYVLTSNGAGVAPSWTGAGSLWTDGGATTYRTDTADNVGIGTTTAGAGSTVAAKLDVEANGNTTAFLEMTDNQSGGNDWVFRGGAGTTVGADNLGLWNEDGAAYTMTWQSGGNVGIGSTSPDARLVVGNRALNYGTTISGLTKDFIINSPTNAAQRVHLLIHGYDDDAATSHYLIYCADEDLAVTDSADFVVEGSSSSDGPSVGIGQRPRPGVTLNVYRSLDTADQNLVYVESNNGGANTAQFLIDNEGDTYVRGRLGVGVAASSGVRIEVLSSSSGTVKIGDTGAAGMDVYAPSGESLRLGANGAEYMVIMGSSNVGNVGIGTTAPGTDVKLHVFRNDATPTVVRIQNNDGVGDRIARLELLSDIGATTGKGFWVQHDGNTTSQGWSADGVLYIRGVDDGTAQPMGIAIRRSTGAVGIGTTTPATRLDAGGNVAAVGDTFNWPRKTATGAPTGTAVEGMSYYNEADNKFYGYDGTTWVDLGAGGGSTPGLTAVLAVDRDADGIIAMNDSLLSLRTSGDSNHGMIWNSTVDGPEFRGFGGFIWKNGTAGATELMRLTSGGSVGIGSANPQGQLDVYETTTFVPAVRVLHPDESGWAIMVNNRTFGQADNTGFGIGQANDGGAYFDLGIGGTIYNVMGITQNRNVLLGDPPTDWAGSTRLQLYKSADSCAEIIETSSDTASHRSNLNLSRKRVTGSTVANGDDIGVVLFRGMDGSGTPAYATAAAIEAEVDGTPGAADMPGRLLFLTTPDGSTTATERMRINNAGNVTIGTSGVGSGFPLLVDGEESGSAVVEARIQNSTSTGSWPAVGTERSVILDLRNRVPTTARNYRFQVVANLGTARDENFEIYDSTSGATGNNPRFSIDDAGDVGIGTENPVAKLHVEGSTLRINGVTYTWPAADGSSGQQLSTNGSGTLSWTDQGGGGGGANTALSNLASVAINTSLLPNANNTLDLGSSTLRWRTLYLGTQLDIDDNGQAAGAAFLRVGDDSFLTDIDVANTLGLYGNGDTTQGHLKLGSAGPTISGVSGSVGIGTTSPLTVLNVRHATAPTVTLERNDTDVTNGEELGAIDFYSRDSSTNLAGIVARIRCVADEAFSSASTPAGASSELRIQTNTGNAGSLTSLTRLALGDYSYDALQLSVHDFGGNVGVSHIATNSYWDGNAWSLRDTASNGWILLQRVDNDGTYSASNTYVQLLEQDIGGGGPYEIAKFDAFGNFTIAGDDATKNSGTAWINPSDRRLKEDIHDIENAGSVVDKLRPVTFRFTEAHRARCRSLPNRYYYGFIAQEFQAVFPESVKPGPDGFLTVDSSNVVPCMVAAVQEGRKQMADLRMTVAAQAADLALSERKRVEGLAALSAKAAKADLLSSEVAALRAELAELRGMVRKLAGGGVGASSARDPGLSGPDLSAEAPSGAKADGPSHTGGGLASP